MSDQTRIERLEALIGLPRGGAGGSTLSSTLGFVTLEQFGATGGDVLVDAPAYTAALASGKPIILGAKTYIVGDPSHVYTGGLLAGASILGLGEQSVLQCTANAPCVDVLGEGCVIADVQLVGTFGAGANNHGVRGNNHSNTIVRDLLVTTPGGSGVFFQGNSVALQGPTIASVRVYVPVNAAAFRIESEYATLTNVQGYGGTYGLYLDAGNINVVGGSFTNNTYALYIGDANANDGHGLISGLELNHSTVGIVVQPLANGYVIRDCHIYYGNIAITGDAGSGKKTLVRWQDCTIDVTDLFFDGSLTSFEGCTWPMSNANTMHPNFNGHASTELFDGRNLDLTGSAFATQGVVYEDAPTGNGFRWRFAGVSRAQIEPTHGRALFGGDGVAPNVDFKAVAGPLVGFENSQAALWLLAGGTAPSATNPTVYSDGAALFLNTPNALGFGVMYGYAGGATRMFKYDPVAGVYTIDLAKTNWQNAVVAGAAVAGAATALPANPVGYLTVQIAGTDRLIPFYSV